MAVFIFFVLDRKCHFWAQFEFEYAGFSEAVHIFRFPPDMPFLGKFSP